MIPLHPMLEAAYNRLPPRDEFSVNVPTGRLLHALALNVRASRPSGALALEIGRYRGVSTAWLYLAGFDHLVSFDPRPKGDEALLRLIYDHTGQEAGLHLSLASVEFPQPWTEHDWKYDFAFIDGDHTGDAPWNDLVQVEQRMAPGGTIVMHDVGPKCPDVLAAFNRSPLAKVILPTARNLFDANACGLGVLRVP